MKIKQFVLLVFLSILTLGCGGGKNGGVTKNEGDGRVVIQDNDDTSPNTSGLNPHTKFSGNWISDCLTLKSGDGFTLTVGFYKTKNGEKGFGNTFRYYEAGDCNRDIKSSVGLGGSIEYKGQKATSTCMAEMFDATYVVAIINGEKPSLTGAELDSFLRKANVNKSFSDLACIYRGDLLLGTVSGTEMAVGTPMRPKNQKVISDYTTDDSHVINGSSNTEKLLLESYKVLQTQK